MTNAAVVRDGDCRRLAARAVGRKWVTLGTIASEIDGESGVYVNPGQRQSAKIHQAFFLRGCSHRGFVLKHFIQFFELRASRQRAAKGKSRAVAPLSTARISVFASLARSP